MAVQITGMDHVTGGYVVLSLEDYNALVAKANLLDNSIRFEESTRNHRVGVKLDSDAIYPVIIDKFLKSRFVATHNLRNQDAFSISCGWIADKPAEGPYEE